MMSNYIQLKNISPWIVAHNMQSNEIDFYGNYTIDGVNYGMNKIFVVYDNNDAKMKFHSEVDTYEFDIQRLIVECKSDSLYVKAGTELEWLPNASADDE